MKVVLRLLGGLVGLVVLAVVVLFCMGLPPGAGDTRTVVEIARPPEVVWAWITEPAHVKQWVSWLKEVREDTYGIEGVGARETWIMDDPNMKQRIEIPSVVTSYDKPRHVGVHIGAPKMFTGDVTYTLTPTAGGTRLEQYGRWHYDDAFARLMVPLITPQANAKGKADFARLKELAEAR
jgi:uncharacterized protein YndB with AHSA1/START domain